MGSGITFHKIVLSENTKWWNITDQKSVLHSFVFFINVIYLNSIFFFAIRARGEIIFFAIRVMSEMFEVLIQITR